MPAKNNKIKPLSELVKVLDIVDADDRKSLPNGGFINLPYKITIVDEDNEIVLDTVSTARIESLDWSKNFYKKDNSPVRFTRDNDLLAIVTIMKRTDEEAYKGCFDEDGNFDVNTIIGFSFPASVVRSNSNFIDWTATFKLNNVEVPGLGDKEESMEIDPKDIPF